MYVRMYVCLALGKENKKDESTRLLCALLIISATTFSRLVPLTPKIAADRSGSWVLDWVWGCSGIYVTCDRNWTGPTFQSSNLRTNG